MSEKIKLVVTGKYADQLVEMLEDFVDEVGRLRLEIEVISEKLDQLIEDKTDEELD